MGAYAASKAGVVGLVKVLAAELGTRAFGSTPFCRAASRHHPILPNAPGATPEVRDFVEGLHALKRIAAPDEIAHSVLHLASDASTFITGTAFLVDGGVSINHT